VVSAGPFCLTIQGIDDCNLGEAYDGSTIIVQPGDSGGPVFQRTSNDNYIKAVGSISAGSTDGHTVLYTLIGPIQSVTNTHLDTNPTG
jgi:V8-like Glu-specific endopeptidase